MAFFVTSKYPCPVNSTVRVSALKSERYLNSLLAFSQTLEPSGKSNAETTPGFVRTASVRTFLDPAV